MLNEDVSPNSTKGWLRVEQNTAKPIAVVTLARKIEIPIFSIMVCRASILLPCLRNSVWYLLSNNIQLGKPITVIKGGIRLVSTVIWYPNIDMDAIDHITPISTIISGNNTGKRERKKKKSINEVTATAIYRNMDISLNILRDITVRI